VSRNTDNANLKNLNFCFYHPLEFFHAMSFITCKQQALKMSDELNFAFDQTCLDMVEEMEGNLSLFVKQEMAYFFANDMFKADLEFMLRKVFYNQSTIISMEEYFQILEQTAAADLLAPMVQAIYGKDLEPLLGERQWNEVKSNIARLRDFVFETGHQLSFDDRVFFDKVAECLKHPDETKQRMTYLVRQFYLQAYRPFEDKLEALSMAGVEKYKQLFMKNDIEVLQKIFKLSPDAIIRSTNVHVSYIAQVTMGITRDDREGFPDWIRIGIHNDKFADQGKIKEKVESFLKAFSDRRRLDIIDLLLEKPWYGQELAQHLGLTPAAITYHMNSFFALDVITLERAENRLYYVLDKSKVKEYFALAQRTILRE